MDAVKPAQDSRITKISFDWSSTLFGARYECLNFPLLCLSAAKLQLHFIQESWQEHSFHFSILAATASFGLAFFFFFVMKPLQCCGAAAVPPSNCSAQSVVSTSRTWSLCSSEPKPQQPLAFTEGTLILCPQPPTARCHPHGKLFWLVSDKPFVHCEQKRNYSEMWLDSSPRMTSK